jgi:AcrR family transcriptional regulator
MVEPRLSGRRGEARRNDATILVAAREVFVADPDAPVAAVAERAGVGISALYRRYPSKEDLLIRLCADGLQQYIDVARAALADGGEGDGGEGDGGDPDPWDVFATFMAGIVEADSLTLTIHLAGRFTPTAELRTRAAEAAELNLELVTRAHAAGVLRDDIGPDDLSYVFEQVASVHGVTPERTRQLRARYLALHLEALRAPGHGPLPGPPPTGEEIGARWQPRSGR